MAMHADRRSIFGAFSRNFRMGCYKVQNAK